MISYNNEKGSTLIELIVSMFIGIIILGGVAMIFVSETRTSTALENRTNAISDLYITAQVMKKALRSSPIIITPAFPSDLNANGRATLLGNGTLLYDKTVTLPPGYPTSFPQLPYYDTTSKTLTYQNSDGVIGIFLYQGSLAQDADKIFWLRDDITENVFHEVVRGMDVLSGMHVNHSGGLWEVILNKKYKGEDLSEKNMSLKFKVWSRNR